MTAKRSINQSALKQNNIGLVLTEIKRDHLIVKSVLARRLRLSFATVSSICEILEEQGFISMAKKGDSTGGRKPKTIQFIPHARYILALNFSIKEAMHIALISLDYVTIKDVWLRDIYASTCEEMFERVRVAVAELMETVGITPSDIIGAGAAVPGLYDEQYDRINYCTNPMLANIGIQHRLEDLLEIPVQVMNDANLAALGQCTLETQPKASLMLLYFTEGIGLGIIQDGVIFHGSTGYAGEIGNMRLSVDADACRLEQFLNLNGILVNYKYYVQNGELLSPRVHEKITEEEQQALFDQLITALNRKSISEITFTKEIGQQLGWVITTLIDLLNPGTVYIGGDIDALVSHLLPHIRNYVRRHSIIANVSDVPIKAASVVNLIVKGVGELVFHHWIGRTYSLQV